MLYLLERLKCLFKPITIREMARDNAITMLYEGEPFRPAWQYQIEDFLPYVKEYETNNSIPIIYDYKFKHDAMIMAYEGIMSPAMYFCDDDFIYWANVLILFFFQRIIIRQVYNDLKERNK